MTYKHITTGAIVSVVSRTATHVELWSDSDSRCWFVDIERFERWFKKVEQR